MIKLIDEVKTAWAAVSRTQLPVL